MAKAVSASDAKDRFDALLADVTEAGEEVIVERPGQPSAVLISFAAYEQVRDLREQKRRADTLEQLRALREEVSAQNRDLTDEQIEEIANRFSHDIIDDMVADGLIRFERDLRRERS